MPIVERRKKVFEPWGGAAAAMGWQGIGARLRMRRGSTGVRAPQSAARGITERSHSNVNPNHLNHLKPCPSETISSLKSANPTPELAPQRWRIGGPRGCPAARRAGTCGIPHPRYSMRDTAGRLTAAVSGGRERDYWHGKLVTDCARQTAANVRAIRGACRESEGLNDHVISSRDPSAGRPVRLIRETGLPDELIWNCIASRAPRCSQTANREIPQPAHRSSTRRPSGVPGRGQGVAQRCGPVHLGNRDCRFLRFRTDAAALAGFVVGLAPRDSRRRMVDLRTLAAGSQAGRRRSSGMDGFRSLPGSALPGS